MQRKVRRKIWHAKLFKAMLMDITTSVFIVETFKLVCTKMTKRPAVIEKASKNVCPFSCAQVWQQDSIFSKPLIKAIFRAWKQMTQRTMTVHWKIRKALEDQWHEVQLSEAGLPPEILRSAVNRIGMELSVISSSTFFLFIQSEIYVDGKAAEETNLRLMKRMQNQESGSKNDRLELMHSQVEHGLEKLQDVISKLDTITNPVTYPH